MTTAAAPDLRAKIGRIEAEFPDVANAWKAMARCPAPRNLQAILDAKRTGELEEGGHVVVSFVGSTGLRLPHLFVDSGKRYDLRCLANLRAHVVVRAGVDATRVIEDVSIMTIPYPNLIDFDRQVVASIVEGAHGLKLWPRRRGSESWAALFG